MCHSCIVFQLPQSALPRPVQTPPSSLQSLPPAAGALLSRGWVQVFAQTFLPCRALCMSTPRCFPKPSPRLS